jgi:hypothetical protein
MINLIRIVYDYQYMDRKKMAIMADYLDVAHNSYRCVALARLLRGEISIDEVWTVLTKKCVDLLVSTYNIYLADGGKLYHYLITFSQGKLHREELLIRSTPQGEANIAFLNTFSIHGNSERGHIQMIFCNPENDYVPNYPLPGEGLLLTECAKGVQFARDIFNFITNAEPITRH